MADRLRTRLGSLASIAALAMTCAHPAPPERTDIVQRDANGRFASLVSAFFGLDNALPGRAALLCPGASGRDGVPVVFSHTLAQETLGKDDFVVITKAGARRTPDCVTLAPAVGAGELRTVLLVGELGSADDPPATVRIVSDILSDGATGGTVSFRGAEAGVIPLDRGPTLVWAEDVPRSEWTQHGRNGGSECPAGTEQIVRATWAGGVRLPSGNEVGDIERQRYRVTVARPDDTRVDVVPFALADLNDNDNNHSLCLDVKGTAIAVEFPAGHLVDPNKDVNPDTRVAVSR
jgi:hypothetical protein